jgi:hypothetical protein
VAIVTPLSSGEVWLDENLLKAPTLVEEGQKLVVGDGGQARVQLLGSSKEQVLKGNALLVIRKADLEKSARAVSRGSIAISDEIGVLSKSASAGSRRGGTEKNYVVGFALELPPKEVDGTWRSNVIRPTEEDRFPQGGVTVTVREIDEVNPHIGVTIESATDFLAFPPDALQPGKRYELHVQGPNSGYYRQFMVLNRQDRESLDQTAHAMRAEALRSGELALLLRLANFYAGFDENDMVAKVLIEVVNQPQFIELDQESQHKVKDFLNQTLRSLDRRNYEGA